MEIKPQRATRQTHTNLAESAFSKREKYTRSATSGTTPARDATASTPATEPKRAATSDIASRRRTGIAKKWRGTGNAARTTAVAGEREGEGRKGRGRRRNSGYAKEGGGRNFRGGKGIEERGGKEGEGREGVWEGGRRKEGRNFRGGKGIEGRGGREDGIGEMERRGRRVWEGGTMGLWEGEGTREGEKE